MYSTLNSINMQDYFLPESRFCAGLPPFSLFPVRFSKAICIIYTTNAITPNRYRMFRTDAGKLGTSACTIAVPKMNRKPITASGTMSLLRISLSSSFFLGLFFAISHPPQSIIRFLSACVMFSQPPSRRMSTSSMRTPNLPGRYIPGSAEMTAPTGMTVSVEGAAGGVS